MFLYIITFLTPFLRFKNDYLYKLFILIWLVIFLCSGYMTGSDWRSYELMYNQSNDEILDKEYDLFFYRLIYYSKFLIKDFFLFVFILKLFYFISVYKLINFIYKSNNILIVFSFLLVGHLLFMLIDNPLRFMVGSIFLNFGFLFQLKKEKKYFLFYLIAILNHISLIFVVLILLFYKKKDLKLSTKKMVILYLLAILLSFLTPFFNVVFGYVVVVFPFLELKLMNSYYVESFQAVFSLGSFYNLILFIIFIKTKDRILNKLDSNLIINFTFIYFLLFRLLIVVPTGFRLNLFFNIFFACFLCLLFLNSKIYLKGFLLIATLFVYVPKIYNTYQYIPYSNSLYYIFTNYHEPYYYRDRYNKEEFYHRTGKQFIEREFQLRE